MENCQVIYYGMTDIYVVTGGTVFELVKHGSGSYTLTEPHRL